MGVCVFTLGCFEIWHAHSEARNLFAEVAETFGLAPDGHASGDSVGAECLEVTPGQRFVW